MWFPLRSVRYSTWTARMSLARLIRPGGDDLTDSAREYIRYGLRLIAEWATEESPATATVCVVSSAITMFQMFYGKTSPWESGGRGEDGELTSM